MCYMYIIRRWSHLWSQTETETIVALFQFDLRGFGECVVSM